MTTEAEARAAIAEHLTECNIKESWSDELLDSYAACVYRRGIADAVRVVEGMERYDPVAYEGDSAGMDPGASGLHISRADTLARLDAMAGT